MKKIFQSGSLLIGALALSITLAMAEGKCGQGKCGNAPKAMKSHKGKCASDKNQTKMKCATGKCGNGTKEVPAKPVPTKGKCGQGKCG